MLFLGKVYQVLYGCLTPGSIGLHVFSYPVAVGAMGVKDKEISSFANGQIVSSLEIKSDQTHTL